MSEPANDHATEPLRFKTCIRFYVTDEEFFALQPGWRDFLLKAEHDVDMGVGPASYVSERRYVWIYLADDAERAAFQAQFGGEEVASEI